MGKRLSKQNIEQMFKYVFEYCGFEVDGIDPKDRIIAYPSSNNQCFIFSMRKGGEVCEGVRVPNIDLFTPPEELMYCAKIILGERTFKVMKKEIENSTFQEILELLKPVLWEKYSTNNNILKEKFIIYCHFTKDHVLKMVTDIENTDDAVQWHDFYEDGSAVIKENWNVPEEEVPPETFNSVVDLAYDIMDKQGTIRVFFNKLRHKGEYEFSYKDCLRLYDEYQYVSGSLQE
ncbi:MAG TPA: hypothetical protein DEO94_02935 [Cyanobacteria bacterium UBA11991]|nr:hypothetical protein [Cyanobacteriota bacterium]MDY6358477.1 hypothetical protein [Cyanobacteriota bacterium]MDY6363531.1 hypothetical protein [Cyanobacteriota bacterium]MDY6383433.1 hypothetical protein [Cyanobacteriota bacterium]HCB11098.1 hypothetical protein [Cyanobacteria bacterium UBA11991]